MNIIFRVGNKFRSLYWKLISKRKKRLFETSQVSTYQYMDELFCIDKTVYDELVKKYSSEEETYWKKQTSFSLKTYFPKTHTEIYNLIFGKFLPLFSEKPHIMDIGCASGEWTLLMAPNCSQIDGYEYSQALVDTANEQKGSAENVSFYQADAKKLKVTKQYDGATILAMLMYCDDINDVYSILKNVNDNLNSGAFLCTRDTLNNENKDVVYLLNQKTGYKSTYWSKDVYYEQFKKAGFELVEEIKLGEVNTRRLSFIHIGDIWRKTS